MEDKNNPIAKNRHPMNQNPKTATNDSPIGTVPKILKIIGVSEISKIATVNTATIARYFANTIFPTEIGAVKSIWSTLDLRSSASVRMDKIGTAIKSTNEILEIG